MTHRSGGMDLGYTQNPRMGNATETARRSMKSVMELVDAMIREQSSILGFTVDTPRILMEVAGYEWNICFLKQTQYEERAKILNDITQWMRGRISHVWCLEVTRRNRGIQLTARHDTFESIDRANASFIPLVLAILGLGFVILMSILYLGFL